MSATQTKGPAERPRNACRGFIRAREAQTRETVACDPELRRLVVAALGDALAAEMREFLQGWSVPDPDTPEALNAP